MKKLFFIFLPLILSILLACQPSQTTQQKQEEPPENKTTPIDRFEKEIQAFEAIDHASPPPKGGIVFCGSSSVRMWKSLEEDMAPLQVLNRGFGGSTFPELLHYADRIIFAYEPSCIVLYEGDNDIVSDTMSAQDVVDNLKKFHQVASQKAPDAKIWFLAVKPSISRRELLPKAQQTNALVQAYIDTVENMEFLDVASPMLMDDGRIRSDIFVRDSLHMNATGYALWTRAIHQTLIEACSE